MDKMQQQEILERIFVAERDRPERSAPHEDEVVPAHDHWARVVLLERAAYLREMARFGDGSAHETIRKYPSHSALLMVRLRSGEPEIDLEYARLITILDGRATLVSGGVIDGFEITRGSTQPLRAGDFAHLHAGTPHQMLLTGNQTISCLVVRIRESAEP